jgi:transposase
VIQIDALWLCAQPVDMRAGADRLLTVVVNTLGEAHAQHGYRFANARASRLKLLVHDGFGVWCATRRLHAGRFVWHTPKVGAASHALQLSTQQFEALTLGLHWQRLGELAKKVVEQFHNENAERYLMAFVYGHLGDHDLIAVRTEAEKYLMMAALNLVECVAFAGAIQPRQ